MKTSCAWSLLATVLLLASCASPIERRIAGNPQLFNALNEHQKSLVQKGAVEEGMSKEVVFLAWGKPDRVSDGSKMGRTFNRWSYAGYDPVFYGPSYGGGAGAWLYDPYYYSGPPVTYLPYEERWVEFLNSRVSAWSISRR